MSDTPSAPTSQDPPPPAPEEASKPEPPPGTAPRSRSGRRRIVVGALVLVIAAAGCLGFWLVFLRGRVRTDDARVAGRMVDVSPQVAGRIATIRVKVGDRVAKGDVLFDIDRSTLDARAAAAKAAVATAEASVALARSRRDKAVHGPRKAEIAALRAVVRRLAAQRANAKADFERNRALYAQKAVPSVVVQHSRATYDAAQAAHDRARQRLRLMREGTRSEDIQAARTEVKLAEAKVAQARAALHEAKVVVGLATVTAPFGGVVVRRWLEPGAAAAPGRAVLTLFDPTTTRVDANIEEKDLDSVRVGDRVDITIDAYPGRHFTGRVSRILQATNSLFSLIPAGGVSGTFIKVTQRVPLRVELLHRPDLPLAPGLSAELTIYSGTTPAGGRQASGRGRR